MTEKLKLMVPIDVLKGTPYPKLWARLLANKNLLHKIVAKRNPPLQPWTQ